MIIRSLSAAIAAGLLASFVLSAVQAWKIIPLILQAETYELASWNAPLSGNLDESLSAHGGHHKDQETGEDEAWAPEDGFERIVYTLVSNIIVGVGFALIMMAAVLLSGRTISLANGAIWGLIGFLIFSLVPGAGLSPELPGMVAADLYSRQAWWFFAVTAAVIGVICFVQIKSISGKAIGLLILLLPHLIGAPLAPHEVSNVPAILAAEFVALSYASMAIFWVTCGSLLGLFMDRFALANGKTS